MKGSAVNVANPKVAEAAVIGKPDKVKGRVIVELVIPRAGNEESEKLREELAKHMRTVLGPVAYPEAAFSVKDVFKTRPVKIMRRAIKAKALKNLTGDLLPPANLKCNLSKNTS